MEDIHAPLRARTNNPARPEAGPHMSLDCKPAKGCGEGAVATSPGSAGILPAALGGAAPRRARPNNPARPEAPPQPLRSAQRRHPIGNWNWQLATFPHWQH